MQLLHRITATQNRLCLTRGVILQAEQISVCLRCPEHGHQGNVRICMGNLIGTSGFLVHRGEDVHREGLFRKQVCILLQLIFFCRLQTQAVASLTLVTLG